MKYKFKQFKNSDYHIIETKNYVFTLTFYTKNVWGFDFNSLKNDNYVQIDLPTLSISRRIKKCDK